MVVVAGIYEVILALYVHEKQWLIFVDEEAKPLFRVVLDVIVEKFIRYIHQIRMHPILSVQKERFEPVFLFLACHLQSLEHRICELQVSVSQILELVGKFRSKLFLVTDHHYLLSAEDRNEDLWLQGMSRFIDNHTEVHFIPHVLPVVLLVTGFPKLFRNQFMTINASSANDTERLDKCPITFLNERQKLILLFCEILFKLFYFLDGFFDILLLFFPNEGFFDVIKS